MIDPNIFFLGTEKNPVSALVAMIAIGFVFILTIFMIGVFVGANFL